MRAELGRVDPPAARHAEMEDEGIASVGGDEPVFGAAREAGDRRAGEPLAQVDGKGAPQVRPPRLDGHQPSPLKHGNEALYRGFDLGQLRHERGNLEGDR